MLKINQQGLALDELNALIAIRSALEKMPEKTIYESLRHLPFLEGRIHFQDEGMYDSIDRRVLEPENQLKLFELYSELLAAHRELDKHKIIKLEIKYSDITDDHMGRPVIKPIIRLSDYPEFLAAHEWTQDAKSRMWATWSSMIEDLTPLITRDLTGSGGTRGSYHAPVKWTYLNGKIVCRRGE